MGSLKNYPYCAYREVGVEFTNAPYAILILCGVSMKIQNYDILTSRLSPRVLVLNIVLRLICSKFRDDFFSSAQLITRCLSQLKTCITNIILCPSALRVLRKTSDIHVSATVL